MRKMMNKNGFTLVELLVVMGIIGILIGLLFPAIGAAKNAAHKAQAGTEVRAIAAAIEQYYAEYGKLPIPDGMQGRAEPDYFTENTTGGSTDVIKILTVAETDSATPASLEAGTYNSVSSANVLDMNPRKIVFLEAQGGANDGTFLDPWGEQYQIKFDADYTGKLEFYSGGANSSSERLTKTVVVVSKGPDGLWPNENGAPGDTNGDGKIILGGENSDRYDEVASHLD